MVKVSSISCGLARPRSLMGGKPTQAAVSHGPGKANGVNSER